jgi:hypothetical protein
MQGPSSLSIVFVAIAAIFIGVALRDYLIAEGKMTIVRKIWIRMAIIFASVGIGLFFVQIFFF